MTFHSSMLIFELLNLHFIVSGAPLSFQNLNKAFNILLNITNKKEKTHIHFDFPEEWEKFIKRYDNLIEIEEDSIIDVDLDELYGHITSNTRHLTAIDTDIEKYVHNLAIYKALNISANFAATKDLFILNNDFIATIFSIAKRENQNLPASLERLKKVHELLITKLKEIETEEELINLKMALTYYDSNNTLKSNSPYATFGWYAILFENNTKSLTKLSYEIIKYAVPFIEEWINTPEEEREEGEENYSAFEIFLSKYLSNLLTFIENCHLKSLKENLIEQKYLLLSLPELKNAYDLLIEEGTLANYKVLPNEESFTFGGFYPTAISAILSLKYSDLEILNNETLYEYTTTRLLFIKTFLMLSPNYGEKKLVIELLTIRFQNNPNFKITNDLIESIILSEINGRQIER